MLHGTRGLDHLLGNRHSLSFPGFYVVIYTFNGADPLFPIVGEVIRILSSKSVITTPSKWTINGESRICSIPGLEGGSIYDFNDEPWWTEENSLFQKVAN
jgi:hypothetical protein